MVEVGKNVLIMQLGETSVTMNVGLNALIKSVLNYDEIEDVLGCIDGMYGLLNGEFVDLASQSQKTIQNLIHTPGTALGSRVADYSDEEYARAAEVIKMGNIGFLFVLGDENSVEFCTNLERAVKTLGHDLRLIMIPFSMYNSLPLTDHCLGYGSAAKYIATLLNEVVAVRRSSHGVGVVTVIEFEGCVDQWLLCSTSLVRRSSNSSSAPHVILTGFFNEQTFINKVQKTIRECGECVIVTGGNLVNRAGENLSIDTSVGKYIKRVIQNNFELEVDFVSLADWGFVPSTVLSAVDVEETVACAQRATEMAIERMVTGKMIILLRTEGTKYTSEISCVDIANTLGKKKEFPEGWYNNEEENVDAQFFKYAAPLIAGENIANYENGVPVFAKLRQLR